MLGILIALLSGALMSVQGIFNTEITKNTSLWISTGWVQLSAFAVCLIMWAVKGFESPAALFQVEHKYMLLGGVLGTFITVTVIKSIAALGPAKSAMLIVIAQIFISYMIEVFGFFQVEPQAFSLRKLAGVAVAVIGIIIFSK